MENRFYIIAEPFSRRVPVPGSHPQSAANSGNQRCTSSALSTKQTETCRTNGVITGADTKHTQSPTCFIICKKKVSIFRKRVHQIAAASFSFLIEFYYSVFQRSSYT